MKIMKIGRWELSGAFGWFAGNPIRIGIDIVSCIDDYPEGIAGVAICTLYLWKFECGFWIDKI